jgi:archaellum component FlaG (FlaF/FlaG flagellin family)
VAQFRYFLIAFALLLPLFPKAASAQDLALTNAVCEPSGRIAFSITNFESIPSGTYRIRVTNGAGNSISNFGPQSSLTRGTTLNAFIDLRNTPQQNFRITVDPGNNVPDRNRGNNTRDVFCSSSGPGSSSTEPGDSQNCRDVEILGLTVTLCEPGSNPPPSFAPGPDRGFDLAVENERCGRRQVRLDIRNLGSLESDAAQVVLLRSSNNSVVETWQIPDLLGGEFVELAANRPADGDYILAIVQNGDDNPHNDSVTVICGNDSGGPITLPPANLGGDVALQNARCGDRRIRVDARNIGGTATQSATVVLIDDTDTVIFSWQIQQLSPGQVGTLTYRGQARGDFRVAIFDADDGNLGNNFIFFTC